MSELKIREKTSMTFEECRFANLTVEGAAVLALKYDESYLNLTAGLDAHGQVGITSTDDILSGKVPRQAFETLCRHIEALPVVPQGFRFGPCVRNPQKMIMIGLNYAKHALEAKLPIPKHPVVFNKFNNALSGHGEPIRLPLKYAAWFDYEAELVIVIGRTGADVSEAEALDHVFGYCVGNDLSARDLQLRTSQWLTGKSLDQFAPIGPFLTGKALVHDPDALQIGCSVNGTVRQSSSTADMIFDCRQLVSYASRYMTLHPGDLIFTGTPEGVAGGYPPGEQPWLVPGDEVTVTIEGLGSISNPMIA
jgi:2-keto-4-pentenoate hydratase/2-oxohepta-3-ene-1,7-dioic acid hydratase in catechol pathway